jgi:hypothetical protein
MVPRCCSDPLCTCWACIKWTLIHLTSICTRKDRLVDYMSAKGKKVIDFSENTMIDQYMSTTSVCIMFKFLFWTSSFATSCMNLLTPS